MVNPLFHTYVAPLKTIGSLLIPPLLLLGARRLRAVAAKRHTRIRFRYAGAELQSDASHHLPTILEYLPDFGRNLADVILALNVTRPRVIDVGANIGDTAVLLAQYAPGCDVLCVEGDERFMPDLKLNTAHVPGVTVAQAVVGDRTGDAQGTFTRVDGTARLHLDTHSKALKVWTLDDLLLSFPEFAETDLLKIDTDGFDAAILRGSRTLLATAKPAVFFEWHPDLYTQAGEHGTEHVEFLTSLGYELFVVYTNRGEPLLVVDRPGRDVWASLDQFSRGRRQLDNWHYDVAAFTRERESAWRRLAEHYAAHGTHGHLQHI